MPPARIPLIIDYWQRPKYSRLFVWVVLPVVQSVFYLLIKPALGL